MYLSYNEYINMGGALDEPTFNDLERQAEMQINQYTFNRLIPDRDIFIPDEVKRCMYALIRLVSIRANMLIPNDGVESQIKGQSNDGVSISYEVLDAADVFTQATREIKNTILSYLFGVKDTRGHRLTYRGLYPDE